MTSLDDAVAGRRWWLEQWPDGDAYVTGQVAQDLQDRLLEDLGLRWPRCAGTPGCAGLPDHELRVEPDLGADPHWVCEAGVTAVARLGQLPGP